MPGKVIFTNPLPLVEGQRVTVGVTSKKSGLAGDYLALAAVRNKVAGVDVRGIRYMGFTATGGHSWHIYGQLTGDQDEGVVAASALALMPADDDEATAQLVADYWTDGFSGLVIPWNTLLIGGGILYLVFRSARKAVPKGAVRRYLGRRRTEKVARLVPQTVARLAREGKSQREIEELFHIQMPGSSGSPPKETQKVPGRISFKRG